jgi:hypothetical protein
MKIPAALLKRIEKLEAQSAVDVAPLNVRRLIDPNQAELDAIGADELVILRVIIDPPAPSQGN